MIQSKKDYLYYLEADRVSLMKKNRKAEIRPRFIGDEIWKFQRLLRKVEFYQNCKNSVFSKIYLKFLNFQLNKLRVRYGFSIPCNVFGPGLSIAHIGTIVIHSNVRIGANCRVHIDVNIGANGHPKAVPVIGDNVYIAPGAKIFGAIEIADGIVIGANSVVNKSFIEPNITIAGIPARKISDKSSNDFLLNRNTL